MCFFDVISIDNNIHKVRVYIYVYIYSLLLSIESTQFPQPSLHHDMNLCKKKTGLSRLSATSQVATLVARPPEKQNLPSDGIGSLQHLAPSPKGCPLGVGWIHGSRKITSWWLNLSTHLKNMRKSNWIMKPQGKG